MLSRTAEHALRAMLFLARTGGDEPVPAERVAEALGAPRNYLGKTLQALTRSGLLEGLRGAGGGYRLLADPSRLSIAEVVDVVEDRSRKAVCLLGDRPCDDADPCGVHQRWTELETAARAHLRRTTLLDLLGDAVDDGEPALDPDHPTSTNQAARHRS